MIKCSECGNEFSYGRKISCCNTIFFGIIFIDNKKDHKWNCITHISNSESTELLIEEISKMKFVDDKKPIHYNWNCDNSRRFQHQEDLEIEMRAYIKIFE